MTLSTKPYKGARDFYPEDKRLQKYLLEKMRSVCERYGYEEYDAPLLEPTELYLQKGNQEIIQQQTYTFTDRGDRSVTLRTEMTPSVARMVAGRRQELGYPLRWYSIPQCWRYERMQRGRGREFYQLNVDIFGVDGVAAEHELILLARDLLASYGATEQMYSIRVSSRAFMGSIFTDEFGLAQDKQSQLFRLIDRVGKLDETSFTKQLDELFSGSGKAVEQTALVRSLLEAKSFDDIPEKLRGHASLASLRDLFDLCRASGIANLVFDATITRGFDYYTDIVFEVFDTHPDNNRSMFGGGRYDSLVASFGVDPVATVGFGMGDMTLQNFLELHELLPNLQPETDVYVISIGDVYASAVTVAAKLREHGVRVALDATNRKLDKQIKTADKKAVPFVLFVGGDEVEENQFTLRELNSGQEEKGSIDHLVSHIRSA